MMKPIDTNALLKWYRENARDLPWRRSSDPYAIWVSEIMLQQTRVETVIPYFQRWMERFPTLEDVADAEEDQVLGLWEGLGYYSRARNLHRATRMVREEYSGMLPKDPEALRNLPGIGRYTAAALSSIAFGKDAAALDGNIRRVLTRYFDISSPLGTAETERVLWNLVEENLPPGQAGSYNQALMELGALICTPASPSCSRCPLASACLAKRAGIQEERPVRAKKDPLPHLQVTAAVFRENRRVLLAKRPPEGLLGGMWEFPGGKQEPDESLPDALIREIWEEFQVEISVEEKIGVYHHAYTHYKVTLHAFSCTLPSRELQLTYHTAAEWVPLQALQDYPMGKLDRLISQDLLR
jgi:A/G-specific adenine glycosylase